MIIIPGEVIALLSFPGVIVHEAAHMLACRIRKVAVLDVCFFRFGNPAGYVIHEPVEDFASALLISLGPFLVNSLLCVLFCFPAFIPVRVFDQPDPLSYFLIWLGVSIGMHAFPSNQDASNLWHQAATAIRRMNLLALLVFPLVALVYVANILRFVWFDVIYGVAIGLGLPELVLNSLI